MNYFLLLGPQNSTVASASQGNSASQASQTQSGPQSGSASGNATASATPSPIVSSFTSTIVTLASGRQATTIVSVFNTTITPTPTQQTTAQGNGTTSATSSSSTGPLPTAPADVDGGGQDLPGGAPHPGENKNDPKFGPDDSYTSAALALSLSSVLALVGSAAASLMLL